jgi:pimeloyl-ACP methyl ester carboxylesterase
MPRGCAFCNLRLRVAGISLLVQLLLVSCRGDQPARTEIWSDPSPHKILDVMANGARLNCLDWGGNGEALILIPGSRESPHAFDGIAPQLTDKFRVVAYARRGDVRSESKGPYDVDTMVEDLRQLLDKLGISRANLAGWSLGGHELTRFAGLYPERVGKLVYLDAAYDWSDPGWDAAMGQPLPYNWPPSRADLQSFSTYRSWFAGRSIRAGVQWSATVEAYARDYLFEDSAGLLRFIYPDSDGKAQRTADRAPYRRDYRAVKAQTLAIYVPYFLPINVGDAAEQEATRRWTDEWWHSWQKVQRAKFEIEMRNGQVRTLDGGNHMTFLFTHEREVVSLMRSFLLREDKPAEQ